MKSIWVAGDFFRDEFNIGYKDLTNPVRFHVDETIKRPGGAANTLANARSICNGTAIQCKQTGYSDSMVLKRWVEENNTVFEYWDIEDELQEPNPWCIIQGEKLPQLLAPEYKTLIVSEYNKGFSSQPVPALPIFNLLIADSRYRTAPIQDLKHLAQTSIWRCTGKEYDQNWAQHFDWVIHTHHGGEVYLIDVHGDDELPFTLIPPHIKVVDPVGAGDTFTAALAASLTDAGRVQIDTMVDAAEFAIKAAQNVCMKRFTATTDVQLKR